MLKGVLITIALGGALLTSPAMAAETVFAGYTDGCFGNGCTPTQNSGSQSTTLPGSGLTFLDAIFNGTTAGGFLAIGADAAIPNIDNLGSFTLTGTPFTYTGNVFDLLVSFTAPAGTSPATSLFSGVLTGAVLGTDQGGAFIDFDNTPRNFTFNGGTFSFSVNDVSVTPGRTVPVSGTIRAVAGAVPEPATWAMMLVGFGAIGFTMRRRNDKAARVRLSYS